MTVNIGVNPIAWSNDDMRELGADISVETCLDEARLIGYQGIELGHKFPREAAQLTALLSRYQLRLISGWYSCKLLQRTVAEEMAALDEHLALLVAAGCQTMIVAETCGCIHGDRSAPLSTRPQVAPQQWEELGQKLTSLAEYLHERGLKTAYHHHMGTVVESVEDIHHLMAASGESVGLLLDTGHLYFAGGDPLEMAQRYGSRITHVHCKDVRDDVLQRVKKDDSSFLDAVVQGVFTVPGDGCIAYPEILAALKAADYQGWLVVEAEQDPEQANPYQYASMGYRYLVAAAQRAGLVVAADIVTGM